MALFLDSANLEDAQRAAALGFVQGATTNPGLLAKAGHRDPKQALTEICALLEGPVFYQLTQHSVEAMQSESAEFMKISPNLGLKIMATIEGMRFCAQISNSAVVAITGVFAPSQVYLAAQAGARFVIPYVNRITRFTGAGIEVVSGMAETLYDTQCELLAAGIKTPAEAIDTLLAGAHHLSLPLEVIEAMSESELTRQALEAFDRTVEEQGW
jgi:transaldolase